MAQELGNALAEKLDFSASPWLANYFVRRFPTSALKNISLSARFVQELFDEYLEKGQSILEIAGYQVLTDAQYRKALEQQTIGRSAYAFLQCQVPPDAAGLLQLVHLDDTVNTATLVLSQSQLCGFDRLTDAQQRDIVERAHPHARVNWLGKKNTLSEAERTLALRWLRECVHHHHTVEVSTFLSKHLGTIGIDALLDLNVPLVNCTLAKMQVVHKEQQQRKLLGLDVVRKGKPKNIAAWALERRSYMLTVLRSSCTHARVIGEVENLLGILTRSEVAGSAKFRDAYREVLALSRGDVGKIPRDTKSPLATKLHATHTSSVVEPQEVNQTRTRRDVLRTSRKNSTRVAPTGAPKGDFREIRRWADALPYRTSTFLLSYLGENDTCWDAFLALSESWDGTFEELLQTAKNLQ